MIVKALQEYHNALHARQDVMFATGKLAGAVEGVLNIPRVQQPIIRKYGANLLNKRELCEQLGFKNPRYIDRLMSQKKIPFLKLGYKTVLFDLKKVQIALENFEARAASLPR